MLNFTEKSKEFQKLSAEGRQDYLLHFKEKILSQMTLLESDVADARLRTEAFHFFIEQAYFARYLNIFQQFEHMKPVYVSTEYRYIDLQSKFSGDDCDYALEDFFWIEILDKKCKLGLKRHLTDIPSEAFMCLDTQKKIEALAHGHLDSYSFKMKGPLTKLKGFTILDFDESGQFQLEEFYESNDLDDILSLKLQESIHYFLFHQERLIDESQFFDAINREDFQVELLLLFEKTNFQIDLTRITGVIENTRTNHEALLACYTDIDLQVLSLNDHAQQYFAEQLKKMMASTIFMLHPLADDAISFLKANALIKEFQKSVNDGFEYEIQTLGPKSLILWLQKHHFLNRVNPANHYEPLFSFLRQKKIILAVLFNMAEYEYLHLVSVEQISEHIDAALMLRIYDFSLHLIEKCRANVLPANDESQDVFTESLQKKMNFSAGLKDIHQMLHYEIARLQMQFATMTNPKQARMSITGVTKDKLGLAEIYREVAKEIIDVVLSVENQATLNIYEPFSTVCKLEATLIECLELPANQCHGFFYNSGPIIESREQLKKILLRFAKMMNEQEVFVFNVRP